MFENAASCSLTPAATEGRTTSPWTRFAASVDRRGRPRCSAGRRPDDRHEALPPRRADHRRRRHRADHHHLPGLALQRAHRAGCLQQQRQQRHHLQRQDDPDGAEGRRRLPRPHQHRGQGVAATGGRPRALPLANLRPTCDVGHEIVLNMGGRMNRRGRLSSIIVVLAVGLMLLAASCSSGGSAKSGSTAGNTAGVGPKGPPKRGGTLRYGLEAEADGLNPTTNRFAISSYMMGGAVFDPLALRDKNGDVRPYLAESITPQRGLHLVGHQAPSEHQVPRRHPAHVRGDQGRDGGGAGRPADQHRREADPRPDQPGRHPRRPHRAHQPLGAQHPLPAVPDAASWASSPRPRG